VYWKADTSSLGRASGCHPELLFVASVAVRMLSERIAVANRPSDHPMRLRPEKPRISEIGVLSVNNRPYRHLSGSLPIQLHKFISFTAEPNALWGKTFVLALYYGSPHEETVFSDDRLHFETDILYVNAHFSSNSASTIDFPRENGADP
jgi:hypothetical protein